jgi:3-hydroxyacyl-[acyl-carrier-protein] dehydratase
VNNIRAATNLVREKKLKEPLVDFSSFDEAKPVFELDEILEVNPHRFEMRLLDAILHLDAETAVGYKDISQDEFWVRGHFPERPLMPGVLICECAAQLSSFFAIRQKLVDHGYVGLGGLEKVRFRGPVAPGDRLLLMLRKRRVRRNQMFTADFQGYVDKALIVDGIVCGVALGD